MMGGKTKWAGQWKTRLKKKEEEFKGTGKRLNVVSLAPTTLLSFQFWPTCYENNRNPPINKAP